MELKYLYLMSQISGEVSKTWMLKVQLSQKLLWNHFEEMKYLYLMSQMSGELLKT